MTVVLTFMTDLCKYLLISYSQSGWSIPVELVIGPSLGISYVTHQATTVSQSFESVFQIQSMCTC